MANHAYVIPKGKMPTADQINKDAQEIVRRKFPQFVLDYIPPDEIKGGEANWHLHSVPDDGYLGMIFWIDEYGDPESFDEKTETWSRMLPCIEFRHGHAYRFMWWVEYEIREELARLYDAYSVDDATGEFDPPQLERYDTYRDYLVRTRWADLEADPAWKDFLNNEMDFEREALPEKYKPLIGARIE